MSEGANEVRGAVPTCLPTTYQGLSEGLNIFILVVKKTKKHLKM